MNTREDGKAFRDPERERDPLMGQGKTRRRGEKSGSVRCSPWHVNAQKILFMRDARLQRDETGFSRQVELQDDDDYDFGGSRPHHSPPSPRSVIEIRISANALFYG